MSTIIEQQLEAAGHTPQYRYRAHTDAAIQALVAEGLAAAILPRMSVDESDPAVALVALPASIPSRRLMLVWHGDRGSRSAIETFAHAARTICAQIEWRGGRPNIAA